MFEFELQERIEQDIIKNEEIKQKRAVDLENNLENKRYQNFIESSIMAKKYLYEHMPGRIVNPSISDLDSPDKCILVFLMLVSLLTGCLIGSNFNSNTNRYETEKELCEKELPRNLKCVPVGIKFKTESK